MFGVRLTSLFTSRWMALAWAVLICLTAIQYVGGQKTSAPASAQGAAAQQAKSGDQNNQDAVDAETKREVDIALKALH